MDVERQGEARGVDQLSGDTGRGCALDEPLAVVIDFHFLEAIEVA